MKKFPNHKNNKIFILCFFIFFSLSHAAAEISTISFKADKVTASVAENKKSTNLIGNAEIKVDSLTISADRIEIFGKDYRYVNANGSVKGSDTEKGYSFQADLINFDRKTDTVTMFGKIELKDTKNDVTITAENMEYKKKQEVMIIRFSVKIINKDINCISMFALYNRKEAKVELTGRPIVKKAKDEFRAGKISVNLETEDIALDGRVRGSVEQVKEEKDDTDKTENQNESESTQNQEEQSNV
ncbi:MULTISPECIES: LptA/OstA family protein [unclassified Treponema]|uniref:LptA/OstA family protein n=1 Tax=unclassified Treponema TaxID=2638727 RepID=UPI0020A2E021|nr:MULTISPECIES: LptA/OstA family protein [unclassified Treponema]UTC66496.1 lipopolysaccharide transporter LptA [Treponema sp. OMZ 789]UTC69228.1 lipopolysaccharide transporter LptA [Treponema sp. OMZ 790]UTC71941.1 lipopolysaccharide transporter LptA [Treponema sp. OMZ 791]